MRRMRWEVPTSPAEAERLRDLLEEALPPHVRVGEVKLRPGPANLATHALIGTHRLCWRGRPLVVDTAITMHGGAQTLPIGGRPVGVSLLRRLRRHDARLEAITGSRTGWPRLLALLQARHHAASLSGLHLQGVPFAQHAEQGLRDALCRLAVLQLHEPQRRIAEALLPSWSASPAELVETVEVLLT